MGSCARRASFRSMRQSTTCAGVTALAQRDRPAGGDGRHGSAGFAVLGAALGDDVGDVLEEHLGGQLMHPSIRLEGPEQDGDGVGLVVVGRLEAALTHGGDHRLPCRHCPCRQAKRLMVPTGTPW